MQNEALLRKVAAIAVPLILLAALIAVSMWGSEQAARAEGLTQQVQSIYRHTFFELSDNVTDLQVALKKLSVAASSAQYVQLLQDVRRLSGEATANLGNLPASHVDTMALNRFVIQAGDYANTLSVRILNGGMPGADDREQLDALYEASVRVAAALEDRLSEEAFPTETVTSETYFESALAAEGETGGTQEANLSNYPTLIYDGPFSDSTEKAEPLGLPEETVDAEAALARASESLGGASLTPDGETLGSIETYDFSGTDAAGRSVEISITKRGGCVLTMMKTPEGAAEGKPVDAEVERYKAAAADYLSAQGYPAMTSSYAQYYAGIAVFNFAAEQGGVVLYPDLVKVYVERQSAEVVGLDARSYFFSHRERALPIPALTEEDARNAVSDRLTIETVRLALIPKTPVTEVLCYECTGKYGDAAFVVYINAQSGAEEQLFEIINSDEGEFTV